MTNKDFLDKCEWEGGYCGLAQSGFESKELKDKKLRALWEKYLPIYKQLEAIEHEMDEYLEI